jgi:hypothetical protein
MTDTDVGAIIRWLCTIPGDASIRIRIYVDECEMAFGAAHPVHAGWYWNAPGNTLVECLANIWAKRANVDKWVADHRSA